MARGLLVFGIQKLNTDIDVHTVASTKETTLIGCISDVVQPERGPDVVA